MGAKKKHKKSQSNIFRTIIQVAVLLFLCIGIVVLFARPTPEIAMQIDNPHKAQVSFTFDDGFESTYAMAAPILAKHDLRGVLYVATGCLDGSEECQRNVGSDSPFMTWTQLKQLQTAYGWEIASHTVNHRLLSTLSTSEKQEELAQSKALLESYGISVTNFASPFGDYDYETLAIAAQYYSSHRGFKDNKKNTWPYNTSILQVKQVQGNVSVEDVKVSIDEAIAKRQWLILVFHDLKNDANLFEEEYEYSPERFEEIAAYVAERQRENRIKNVTIQEGLADPKGNIFAEGTFEKPLGNKWEIDNKDTIVQENGTIVFTGSSKAAHLFSPRIHVESRTVYTLRSFVNALNKRATEKSSGEFGFYIDEYDQFGNWISGKWIGAVADGEVVNFNETYRPSSSRVDSMRLQIYLKENATGSVSIDNLQLYNYRENK